MSRKMSSKRHFEEISLSPINTFESLSIDGENINELDNMSVEDMKKLIRYQASMVRKNGMIAKENEALAKEKEMIARIHERNAEIERQKRLELEETLHRRIAQNHYRMNETQKNLNQFHDNILQHAGVSIEDTMTPFVFSKADSPQIRRNIARVNQSKAPEISLSENYPIVTSLVQHPVEKWRQILDNSFAVCGQCKADTTIGFHPEKQQQLLGPFYRKDVILPIRDESIDLRFLNIMTPSSQSFLTSLSTNGTSKRREGNLTILLGPSGCGKTKTLLNIGKYRYILFMECRDPLQEKRDRLKGGMDNAFLLMMEGINALDSNDPMYEQKCRTIVSREYLARSLLLYWYLASSESECYPEDFLHYQLSQQANWKLSCLRQLLVDMDYLSIRNLLEKLYHTFPSIIQEKAPKPPEFDSLRSNPRVILCIDEIHYGYKYILAGKFHSKSRDDSRGISRILLQECSFKLTMHDLDVVVAGTSLGVALVKSIGSDYGKGTNTQILTDFSYIDHPWTILEQWIDLSDLHVLDFTDLCALLSGRPRMTTVIVDSIPVILQEHNKIEARYTLTKQEILKRAMTRSLDMFQSKLKGQLMRAHLSIGKMHLLMSLLSSVTIYGSKACIELSVQDSLKHFSETEMDLVELGLSGVRMKSNYDGINEPIVQWVLNEPLAIHELKQFLSSRMIQKEHPAIYNTIQLMEKTLCLLGPKTQAKGKFAEPIILDPTFSPLWIGNRFIDLPLVSNAYKNTLVSISQMPEFEWLQSLSFDLSTPAFLTPKPDDLIQTCKTINNQWIRPDDIMRPDALLFLMQNGKRYMVSVGMACYWNSVSTAKIESQFNSTDPNLFFNTEDGIYVNDVNRKYEWLAVKNEFDGFIRIHVHLPVASGYYEFNQDNIRIHKEIPVVDIDKNRRHLILNVNLSDIERWYILNSNHEGKNIPPESIVPIVLLRWASGVYNI